EHPRKNLSVLVEAVSRVRQEMPEVVLLKVGDAGVAHGHAQFLENIDTFGMRDAVKFYGNADDEALRLLYNVADVFVFPSTFEGFGIPPLEAMACGCPVVSSNATSLSEVVGRAALLRDPADAQGFADAIRQVLTDQKLTQDLRQRGLVQAAKFSWETSAQKTLEVYRKMSAVT
ncbi:MAG: glycosyltransferase family 1 protein, partial [Patescibacteria group bacterium]